MIDFITWTVNPNLFSGFVTVRWYGLMFAIGFWIGYELEYRIFRHEGTPEKWVASIFLYAVIGTIVGARLGHVFFYDWDSRRVTHKPMLWAFDRIVVPVGLVAALIRIGNLMNHEIYGRVTSLPWGFRFVDNIGQWMNGAEPVFSLPSHPTQIYEALCYLAVFALCMWLYWKRNAQERQGLIFGVFMLGIFGTRFLIEYIKNVQEPWEINMRMQWGIDQGQLLSIPFIILGVWLIIRAFHIPRQHLTFPDKFADEKK